MKVGAYLRISRDDELRAKGRDSGGVVDTEEVVNRAIERQRRDCQDLIEQQGWAGSVEWFVDRDVSAYREAVVRTEFERLLDAISAKDVDALVVYHFDRLARQPMDAERLLKVFRQVKGVRFATMFGEMDLYSEQGEDLMRWQVMQAHAQSRAASRRVARKHRELAEEGRPVGGHRPFGLQHDKMSIEPREAEAIRNAVDRLLAGESSASIVRQWNQDGLLTSTGKQWISTTFRQLLKSPRIAGWRVYRDQVALDRDGSPVRGQQAEIVTPEKHEALLAVLSERARTSGQQPGKRRYLLSGLIRCRECGSRMSGNADHTAGAGAGSYSCKPSTTARGGCGRVAVTIGQVDALVEGLIVCRLGDREVELEDQVWPGSVALAAVVARKTEIMNAYNQDALSGPVAFPMLKKAEDEEGVLLAEQRAWQRDRRRAATVQAADPSLWKDMAVEARRQVVSAEIEAVMVSRSAARGGSFDPNRVEIIWRS